MEANNPKIISVSIEYPKTMRDTKPAIAKIAMKSMIGLTIDISASNDFYWWAMLGLNQRPLPCEDSALPLSYAPAAPRPARCPAVVGERMI